MAENSITDPKETNPRGRSAWRQTAIELAVIGAFGVALYLSGYHTQVIGTLQRGLLATGVITPTLSVDPDDMRDGSKEFYFAGPDFKTRSLAGYEGKVIFLNIWASWCPPCIAEMPGIQQLYDEYKNRSDVEFILVSMDENIEDAEQFMESRDMDLPIYHYRGRNQEVYSSNLLPTTYVITPDGKIALEEQGMANYNTSEFREFLDTLALPQPQE